MAWPTIRSLLQDLTPPQTRDRADYEVTQLVTAPVPAPPPTVLEAPPPAPLERPLPPPPIERLNQHRDRLARRRRRGLVALVLVLVLATLAALGGWYLTDGRFTNTPALGNLSRGDAEQLAGKAGLRVGFTEEFSETVQSGLVIDTHPGAGSKIAKGGRIQAAISRGPERFAMPTVVGLTRSAAEPAVQAANLAVAKVSERFSESVGEGVVLSASAKPGAQLKRDAPVNLVVSRGPAPIRIKNYVGRRSTGAQKALRSSGFTVVVTTAHSDQVAKGLVLVQTPASGRGHKGDTITLTESLGPVLVVVPNVRSMGIRAAERAIAQAGFRTRVQAAPVNYLGLGFLATPTHAPAVRRLRAPPSPLFVV